VKIDHREGSSKWVSGEGRSCDFLCERVFSAKRSRRSLQQHWARSLQQLCHEVKLLSARIVVAADKPTPAGLAVTDSGFPAGMLCIK
jgi:hypothetical protein